MAAGRFMVVRTPRPGETRSTGNAIAALPRRRVMAAAALPHAHETDARQLPRRCMTPLKAFIVEDSPVIRENLVAALEEMAPIEVVGTADDEASAVHWLD